VLLGRYRDVFAHAWSRRHALDGPPRLPAEAAFLPAALALQETPPHPAPRRAAAVIAALAIAAALWSCFGQVDIIAVAPGRIVVGDRTKVIQPLEAGVVHQVLVRDGDEVAVDQVLIELDATAASADVSALEGRLRAQEGEVRRAEWLIATLDELPGASDGPRRSPPPAPKDDLRLESEWHDIAARLARFDTERARREAERVTIAHAIAKLDETLPITRQREADIRALADQGFVSGHAGQDRRRDRIEHERDLATQRARLVEARAAVADVLQSRRAYLAETRRALRERLADAQLEVQQLRQQLAKSAQRARLTQLRAPVAGTVQQLAVHTVGGVVTPAQPLMVIVPRDAPLLAEATIDNDDIGFVEPGQTVTVKLDTFPFTRYGTVGATVRSVNADAVPDDQRGAVFVARLDLDRKHLDIEGRPVPLGPGMTLRAEIQTGRRPVIDYLLGPVRQTLGESLRER
jgi:hemolysin D